MVSPPSLLPAPFLLIRLIADDAISAILEAGTIHAVQRLLQSNDTALQVDGAEILGKLAKHGTVLDSSLG